MAYIGRVPNVGNYFTLDAITTSSTATYNLLKGGVAYVPETAYHLIVSLNGVIQAPITAYTVSGSTIVFASTLASTDSIDFITVLGDTLAIGTPSDATVGAAQIAATLDLSSKTVTLPAASVTAHASDYIAWQSVVTAATLTAVAGRGYPINTTSNACTVTLPASASVGDTIKFVDYARKWGTNALTLNPNSLNFQGNSSPNPSYNTDGQSVTITYVDATQGWIPTVDDDATLETPQTYSIDALVVAGGGGGTRGNSGGGGGGGMRTTNWSSSTGVALTITVGTGGVGVTTSTGNSGTNSILAGTGVPTTPFTSAGGGGAGTGTTAGLNGGAGGGGGYNNSSGGGIGNTPNTIPSQGANGGQGITAAPGYPGHGGGGGGASGSTGGVAASNTQAGNGGDGTASSISGASVTYAGGGGGGIEYNLYTPGTGGAGGGGAGNDVGGNGFDGTDGLGGGGGSTYSPNTGGSGGDGVVILSVPDAKYSGTTTGSPAIATNVGGTGKTTVTFTSSGSYTT